MPKCLAFELIMGGEQKMDQNYSPVLPHTPQTFQEENRGLGAIPPQGKAENIPHQ
jgi:hypothetical protein